MDNMIFVLGLWGIIYSMAILYRRIDERLSHRLFWLSYVVITVEKYQEGVYLEDIIGIYAIATLVAAKKDDIFICTIPFITYITRFLINVAI